MIFKRSSGEKAKNHNWKEFIFLLIMGLVFTVAGAVLIFNSVSMVTLDCKRSEKENICYYTTSKIISAETIEIPVSDFHQAEFSKEVYRGHEIYDIYLHTRNGNIKFPAPNNITQRNRHKIVKEINDFLEKTEQTNLKVKEDNRIFFCLMGGLFLLIGIGVLIVALFFGK